GRSGTLPLSHRPGDDPTLRDGGRAGGPSRAGPAGSRATKTGGRNPGRTRAQKTDRPKTLDAGPIFSSTSGFAAPSPLAGAAPPVGAPRGCALLGRARVLPPAPAALPPRPPLLQPVEAARDGPAHPGSGGGSGRDRRFAHAAWPGGCGR